MRITNKIIQNNSLTNINTNKVLQDKLSTMIATNKKIARPSEDPIIALRSLRLRTSVNQTSQYLEKNVQDAKSWLEVTEKAITTLSDVITDVRKQYTKATSSTLTSSDRKIIIEDLKALSEEIYNTGNADFAGRSVFTGYRTEEELTFQKKENVRYSIDETEESLRFDKVEYIHQGDIENDVYTAEITRIRLSHDKLDNTKPTYLNINGTEYAATDITVRGVNDNPDPYDTAYNNPDAIVYVPETGELLLGSNIATEVNSCNVTYEKTEWDKGDLRPEHFFYCRDLTKNIDYTSHGGGIEYNIGVNQSLRVNTNASECFTHDISRDIDDVIRALEVVTSIEETIANLKDEIKGFDNTTPQADVDAANAKLDAAKKAQTFINNKLATMLGGGITKADGYLNRNSVALANCGTTSKRLDLIENRLDNQLSTLKELKSDNEDADIAETAIKLSSAQYSYDAALLSTSKIIKETLLNYI